jgi:dihydrofolate synthase / folylpolyglutamate synthase
LLPARRSNRHADLIERLFALETSGIKLGLENISRLCAALGHPERSFASLHVAGTNGKGSVTAMAHAAAIAAGLRAARYTSPHLSNITERFVVGERPVELAALESVADDVLRCADRLQAAGQLGSPTFFEATTAIAFELFRRSGVELAVVEVGMGGRFDATNVLRPVAAAITTLALDHQEHLGHTLGAIAFEKAGVIKPGITVVSGALPPEAAAVVSRVAHERGAPLIRVEQDTRVESELHEGRARIRVETPEGVYGPLRLALRGDHQIANALVTIRLIEAARMGGIPITRAAVEQGLARTEWPARLELLTFASGKRVLLDAAHNGEGAHALANYLRRWHPERPALVVGVMQEKDASDILAALLPTVSRVVATAAPSPRAMRADELARRATLVASNRATPDSAGMIVCSGSYEVIVEPDPMRAVERALETAETVCVAGSLFLAGAVRDPLRLRAALR